MKRSWKTSCRDTPRSSPRPTFAEAFNQRAILHFRTGNYARSIVDCEKALRLNAHHFGAACGLAQCFMKQKKLRAALRCYRRALRINPNLENVRQAISSLEEILGEEGKRAASETPRSPEASG